MNFTPTRSRITPTIAALGAFLALRPAPAAVGTGDFEGTKVTLLAIDNGSLPFRKDLCYYLSPPNVRAEPVLTPSRDNPHATDSMGAYCYATVLHEGAKFRMWYYGAYEEKMPGWDVDSVARTPVQTVVHEGPVCYAESADGLHWIKPKLGQVEHNGGSDNNAIALPATRTEGVFLIRDDGDPDPLRRYKMVYENTSDYFTAPRERRVSVETAVSPDGLHWKGAGRVGYLFEPTSFYYYNGLFTISGHDVAYMSEGGHHTGRQGFIWVSPDFRRWLPEDGESFLMPEPANPNDRGHDRGYLQVHEGVGPVSYGNVLVGLWCQWHARPNPGDWFGDGTTYGDLGLVVSHDGQHFEEVVKGYVFLDRHRTWPDRSPDIREEEIVTHSGNCILNVGDKTYIYHGRWMNPEKFEDRYSEIGLATIPRDRWGALGLYPRSNEGSLWTAPITLGRPGAAVGLNATGAAEMRLEVGDDRFNLVPDFSGENAGTVASGDGLDCPVAWPKASLDRLVGRKIRLHLRLHRGPGFDPRLYAMYVSSGSGRSP